ncbi:hypothetical protein HSR122_2785 [Halapricum desulfuricans]|nr:hypothetical protein HSR122_2785 [Halapricum desulfuricans]
MSIKKRTNDADLSSLQSHLAKALENAEDDTAKYHIREAYQKIIFLENAE